MALSFNPATRITSGFCGYASQSADNATVIKNLKQAKSSTHHPMLLPALTYGIFWDRCCGQIKDVRVAMQEVQTQTGLLKDYLKLPNIGRRGGKEASGYSKPAESSIEHRARKEHMDYSLLHKRLVEQQARMTNGLADFVSDLGPACHSALSVIRAAALASSSTSAVGQSFGSFSPRGARSKGDQQPDGRVAHNSEASKHPWCRYRDSRHPGHARKEDSQMRYTPMRYTPMRYTPMRYTPVRCTPMRYTP